MRCCWMLKNICWHSGEGWTHALCIGSLQIHWRRLYTRAHGIASVIMRGEMYLRAFDMIHIRLWFNHVHAHRVTGVSTVRHCNAREIHLPLPQSHQEQISREATLWKTLVTAHTTGSSHPHAHTYTHTRRADGRLDSNGSIQSPRVNIFVFTSDGFAGARSKV